MSPSSTSNTMLIPVALVIGNAIERRDVYTTSADMAECGSQKHSTRHHSNNPVEAQSKIMNMERWHEEALLYAPCVLDRFGPLALK